MIINTRQPLGVGVDILETKRVNLIKPLARVAEFVLTDTEYKEFNNHPDSVMFFTSRFALKEAVIKACPETLTFHDFEIAKKDKKPYVHFLIQTLTPYRVLVSLSHSTEYAVGFAMTYEHEST